MAGGKCNLQALMVLREVKTLSNHPYLDINKRRTSNDSILPYEWRIRDVSKIVHAYADQLLPMQHCVALQDKVVEFKNMVDVTQKIYKAFQIDEVAKTQSIEVCFTMDGFNLTNNLTFIMTGLKIINPSCISPLTSEKDLCPLFKKYLPQSRKWCFPLKLVMGKETTVMYTEEFNGMFNFFFKASLEG